MREKVSREPDTSFQVILWLWRLCQGHRDSVVHVYQGPYILASVNGMGIYPGTSLSKFTFSYLWGYWLHCCSGHCRYFLSLSSNFCVTLNVSVLYLHALDGWLGNGPYGGTGDQSLLKFLIYSLYSFTYQMYDFHIFFLLLLIVFSNSLHFNAQ